ncbi:MAG: hypothetical protein WCS52_18670 [bacterium]
MELHTYSDESGSGCATVIKAIRAQLASGVKARFEEEAALYRPQLVIITIGGLWMSCAIQVSNSLQPVSRLLRPCRRRKTTARRGGTENESTGSSFR